MQLASVKVTTASTPWLLNHYLPQHKVIVHFTKNKKASQSQEFVIYPKNLSVTPAGCL
jgi:hypothetical protein